MKNKSFKELREKLQGSCRFFLGSNKVLQVALGKEPVDEVRQDIHLLCKHIKGHVGLLFTELPQKKVEAELLSVCEPMFAKVGYVAKETITYDAGPLEGPSGRLEHTLEPSLRKNGMPTKLNKGVVELLVRHTVCTKGEPLTPAQAALLRIFGTKMAKFQMTLLCRWEDGDFAWLGKKGEEDGDASEDDDEDEEEAELVADFEGY